MNVTCKSGAALLVWIVVAASSFQGVSLAADSAQKSHILFNDTTTTEIYTLSLHDALPINSSTVSTWTATADVSDLGNNQRKLVWTAQLDRKSTRLNSSHLGISYAVFC